MKTLCILGRQPELGLAELESLYGPGNVHPVGSGGLLAAAIDLEPAQINFNRLGGTVKFCKVLTVLDTRNWRQIQEFLESAVPQHVSGVPEGKLRLGLSVYGLSVPVKQLNSTGLALKKIIRGTGKSVRVIPNVEQFLNSAQVLHNQLTGPLGWELIFVAYGNQTIVAQNIAEQDITAYARRDQGRPKRDARVGMLPPKLAQIIVNLAVGEVTSISNGNSSDNSDDDESLTCGPAQNMGQTVLDPFCGTGVIPQEAALMGYDVYGTDLEQRMIDYSHTNLDWLGTAFTPPSFSYRLDAADATSYAWKRPYDFIACETYLGRPFSATPKPEVLQEVIQDVDTIHRKFLRNLAKQIKPGTRACIAVPAWPTKYGFKHLRVLDSLEEMGYTRVSFEHVSNQQLIYHRPGQFVARELIVIIKN